MISVMNLVKQFGAFRAVDGLTFTVPKGQVLGFLGPNGAGKSTTMKMLTTFLAPTSGTARVGNADIVSDSLAVRRQIGYLPESAPSYGEMTVVEFLAFIGEVRGLRGAAKAAALDRVRGSCALADAWQQPIETLSKGYRQRVGFAQALLHDPPVLVLDEPTDGLDPNQKHEVRALIRGMGQDKTIILSTHILEEVEAVCQRVVIIAGGKIVADATPEGLRRQSPSYNTVTLHLSNSDHAMVARARQLMSAVPGVASVELSGEASQTLKVLPTRGASIVTAVSEAARQANLPIAQLAVESGRLDDVFRQITGH